MGAIQAQREKGQRGKQRQDKPARPAILAALLLWGWRELVAAEQGCLAGSGRYESRASSGEQQQPDRQGVRVLEEILARERKRQRGQRK